MPADDIKPTLNFSKFGEYNLFMLIDFNTRR